MRVLFVVNDLDTGGAQTLIEALASTMENRPGVLVLMDRGPLSERIEKVADVWYLRLDQRRPNILYAIWKLRQVMRTGGFGILHTHLLQSDLVGILAFTGRPHVTTVHTSGDHESGMLARLVSRLVTLFSRRFSSVVACSESAREYASRAGYSKRVDTLVIHNGVVIPDLVERNQSGGTQILCLSRWHEMKDHATLLTAASLARAEGLELSVQLAGARMDDRNQSLLDLIDEVGASDYVDLLGSVSNLEPVFSQADVVVISSSHGEALPMAGIEALARAIPVITTDVGDCSQLVVADWMLVPPSDPPRLAAAIGTFLHTGPSSRSSLQSQARGLAERKFDVHWTQMAYTAVYGRLI